MCQSGCPSQESRSHAWRWTQGEPSARYSILHVRAKKPNPTPSPDTALSNRVKQTLLAAGSGPCLRKQSREAGNQLVGFVPTAANEEPHFSRQLPPGPLWCRWEATDPAPRLPCLLLLPMGWETCLERQFCKSALSDKEGDTWGVGGRKGRRCGVRRAGWVGGS